MNELEIKMKLNHFFNNIYKTSIAKKSTDEIRQLLKQNMIDSIEKAKKAKKKQTCYQLK